MRRIGLAAAYIAVSAVAAQADAAGGKACAAGLSADARLIFDAAAPGVTPDGNLRDLVIAHTRPLVEDGKMTREAAEAAAPEAGKCLELLK